MTDINDLKQRAESAGFEFKTRVTSEGETLHYGQLEGFRTLGYSNLDNAVKAVIKRLERKW